MTLRVYTHITTEDDEIQPFTVDLPGKYNHPSSLFLESILSYGRRIELGSRTYLVLLVMSTVKYTSSLRLPVKLQAFVVYTYLECIHYTVVRNLQLHSHVHFIFALVLPLLE